MGGMIIFVSWYKTKKTLCNILIHGFLNACYCG